MFSFLTWGSSLKWLGTPFKITTEHIGQMYILGHYEIHDMVQDI